MRPCVFADVPWMLSLARRMHTESRYRRFDLDERKLEKLFNYLIVSPDGIVLRTDNGFLVAAVDKFWFGDDRYAFEFILYVEPEHRGSAQGVQLVRRYKELATELGAVDVHIENSTLVETERTEMLFSRLGFSRIGGNFVLEP